MSVEVSTFNKGDVVMLKSGGPPMTVEKIASYGGISKVACLWFVNETVATGQFEPVMLKSAPVEVTALPATMPAPRR